MAKDIKLVAQVRSSRGSGATGRLRRDGWLPGIVYGDAGANTSIMLNTHDFGKMLRHHTGENILADLEIEGVGARKVMVKEIQRHPVSGNLLHVDFTDISMTRKMRVSIAIELVGEPEGVRIGGGVLEHLLRELEVECLPGDLVEVLEVDVSKLDLGKHMSVGDIVWNPALHVLTAAHVAVCAVAAPRAEAEPAAEGVEAAVAEPDVVGKGRKAEGEEGEKGSAEA